MLKYMMVFVCLIYGFSAQAQYSATKNAQYLATVKAVSTFKLDDEEVKSDIEKLRENARFNEKLQKMINKLNNRRTKDGTNRKVMKILEKAGEDIYKLLD